MTTRTDDRPTLADRDEFAARLLDTIAVRFRSPLADHAPAEAADYRRCLAAVQAQLPDQPGIGPLDRLDDAVLAWAVASFAEGARFGVAVEAFRRSVAGMRPDDGA